MDDIVVLVGDSLEQLRALAQDKYDIIYERRFGTIYTDSADNSWGTISDDRDGAVAIAKRL